MSWAPKSPSYAWWYACLVPRIQEIAGEHGYAAALHGSLARDLDVVLVPWVEDAQPAEEVVAAIAKCFSYYGNDGAGGLRAPTDKPHGRRAWSIMLGGHAYIDVSVMPRVLPGTISMVIPPEVPGEDPPLPDYDAEPGAP